MERLPERLPDLMKPASGEFLEAVGHYRKLGQRVFMSPKLILPEEGKAYRLMGFYPPLASQMKTFMSVEEGGQVIQTEDITRKCLEMWFSLEWIKFNENLFLKSAALDEASMYETRAQILKELLGVIEEKVTWRAQAEEIRKTFLNTIGFFETLRQRSWRARQLSSYMLEQYRLCHDSDAIDYRSFLEIVKSRTEWQKIQDENAITIITTVVDRSTVKDALWAAMYAFDGSLKDKARKMSALLDEYRGENLRVIAEFGLSKLKREDTWEKEMAKNVEHMRREMSRDKIAKALDDWMKVWIFAG